LWSSNNPAWTWFYRRNSAVGNQPDVYTCYKCGGVPADRIVRYGPLGDTTRHYCEKCSPRSSVPVGTEFTQKDRSISWLGLTWFLLFCVCFTLQGFLFGGFRAMAAYLDSPTAFRESWARCKDLSEWALPGRNGYKLAPVSSGRLFRTTGLAIFLVVTCLVILWGSQGGCISMGDLRKKWL
jgi:hypothetical protein